MAYLRERTGGKLATFTAVNLIVDVCSAKVPRCAVAISHIGLAISTALPWRFQAPGFRFVTWHRRSEKNFEESGRGSASAVQEPASADQNC